MNKPWPAIVAPYKEEEEEGKLVETMAVDVPHEGWDWFNECEAHEQSEAGAGTCRSMSGRLFVHKMSRNQPSILLCEMNITCFVFVCALCGSVHESLCSL